MSAWKELQLAKKSGNKDWEEEARIGMAYEAARERYLDAVYEAKQYETEFRKEGGEEE